MIIFLFSVISLFRGVRTALCDESLVQIDIGGCAGSQASQGPASSLGSEAVMMRAKLWATPPRPGG